MAPILKKQALRAWHMFCAGKGLAEALCFLDYRALEEKAARKKAWPAWASPHAASTWGWGFDARAQCDK